MKRVLFFAGFLLAAGVPAAVACTQASPAPGALRAADDPVATEFDTLAKEYAVAAGEHAKRAQNPALGGAEKRAADHPAIAFYPRFSALVEKGEGRALLWMANRMQNAHPERTKDENKETAWKLIERIADEHADKSWIGAWSSSLTALYVDFGAARVDPLVDRFAAQSKQAEAVSEALFRAREEARRLQNEDRRKALEARLVKDFPETKFGKRVRGVDGGTLEAFVPGIGKVAPDFTTQDPDGVEFKLSDYRGKVVVLDFWGFW